MLLGPVYRTYRSLRWMLPQSWSQCIISSWTSRTIKTYFSLNIIFLTSENEISIIVKVFHFRIYFLNLFHSLFFFVKKLWFPQVPQVREVPRSATRGFGSPETLTHLFWHCRSTQTFWNNVSQWTSEELDLTNLNITPFSPALCLGIIDNISNLLLHHFLLIARHYIYSCKLRNTIPMVQVYTQLVIRSMEIEKQIAFDNNNLASFRKKWATFKQCPSEYNLTNTVN